MFLYLTVVRAAMALCLVPFKSLTSRHHAVKFHDKRSADNTHRLQNSFTTERSPSFVHLWLPCGDPRPPALAGRRTQHRPGRQR